MSSSQKRLFIISQYEGSEKSYHLSGAWWVEGSLDIQKLGQCFHVLFERHESLRTGFVIQEESWICQVHQSVPFQIMVKQGSKETVDELVDEFVQPFDLSNPPLVRVGVVQFPANRSLMILDAHHIVFDGLSLSLFTKELMMLYGDYPLSPLKAQYRDFVSWQEKFFESRSFAHQETYWLKQFSGELPLLDLPTDYSRPAQPQFTREHVSLQFPTSELSTLAHSQGVSLYMVLVAAYFTWLFRLTKQEEIVIGTVNSHRPFEDFNQIVGMITNTLALRGYPNKEKSFTTLLKEAKSLCLEAYAHPDYPFERLVEKLGHSQDPNRHPVFETMFTYEKADDRVLNLKDLKISPCFEKQSYAFDMTLDVIEQEGILNLTFEYDASIFKQETIQRWAGYFIHILQDAHLNPDVALSDMDILPPEEKEQLLKEFNATQVEYPCEKTIVNLFEEQVLKSPDAIAVICKNRELSFQELNERANQLAHYLAEHYHLKPDDRVGILMERSEWMMIAILGVLKAGAAYVPFDLEFPPQRMKYVLDDSQCKVLLTSPQQKEKAALIESVAYVEITEIETKHSSNPNPIALPAHLAYLIYTSGSTGNPKGVMIEHRNVVSFAENLSAVFGMTSADRIYALTTLTFDISVLELLCSLINGIQISLASTEEVMDPDAIARDLREHQITVLQVTPSRLKWLLESQKMELLHSLRVLLVGGEALPKSLAEQLQTLPNIKVFNVYGPTETTIWSSFNQLTEGEITIGTPLLNEMIYILSETNQLQPIGIPGELCIGGDGVGRGYVNRPELTGEKFIENPFRKGERLYRTGDLARWLPNGNLDFLGRNDDQVKIRGHRIELGEIELTLQKHPQVEQAVVIAAEKDAGNTELVAYLIGNEKLNPTDLRQYLLEPLPEYMIPAYFVQMEQFPLNPSGKINKRALPAPEGGALISSLYEAPRNPLETHLVSLWEEVLGHSPIGIHDHFFDRGGHSLKTVQLLSRIHKQLEVDLSLKEIFATSTVAGLAAAIRSSNPQKFQSIEPVAIAEDYALSHAQQRLWVMHQMEDTSIAYNVTGALLLEGKLDHEALFQALTTQVARHESLRTTFLNIGGEPRQKIHPTIDFDLEEIDLSQDENSEEKAREILLVEGHRAFDLAIGPLVRVKLLQLETNSHVLVFNLHHIICDGWSLGILTQELGLLYLAFQQGKENPLEPLTIQYKDYSEWQKQWLAGEQAKLDQAYWHERLSGEIPVLELPTDRPRPMVQTFQGKMVRKTFSLELTQKIRNLMRQNETTLFMGLVALVDVLLYRYSGQAE